MPLLTKPFTILSPGEALQADAVSQDGISASANLSYVGLLIRRRAFDSARQLLDSLEKSKSAPSPDLRGLLRVWVDLETGDFTRAKAELLDWLKKMPGDSLGLSLMQACIVMELERHKETASGSGALRQAAEEVASAAAALSVPRAPAPTPVAEPVSIPEPKSESGSAVSVPEPKPKPEPEPEPKSEPISATPAPEPAASPADETGTTGISDEEIAAYQTVLSDPQAFALQLWNGTGGHRLIEKAPGFAVPGGLAEWMRSDLPGSVAESVASLEGGEIRKITFSFQNLSVSSWHSGVRNAGLVTGPQATSMITWVRADKLFQKQAKSGPENSK